MTFSMDMTFGSMTFTMSMTFGSMTCTMNMSFGSCSSCCLRVSVRAVMAGAGAVSVDVRVSADVVMAGAVGRGVEVSGSGVTVSGAVRLSLGTVGPVLSSAVSVSAVPSA